MNAAAMRPEWVAIVRQCEAQRGSVDGLPSQEEEIGRGWWKVEQAKPRSDGYVLHILYWVQGSNATGLHYNRVGSFYLTQACTAKKRRNGERTGELTVGFDELGRRLIAVKVSGQGAETNVMAVEMELHRGMMLPRPVPYPSAKVS